ncbi:7069_t:CDS:2 [Scutellospora calospora]|uniref:7069_t:CDS:1 n=1 Tax=Scutellospora calospora TaxID=85575 RepID=A0ACA9MNT0_9GLOM|nr:7069_t:CDS:2 [Scutellospora calospora]
MSNIDESTVVRGRDHEMDVILVLTRLGVPANHKLEVHRAIIEVPSQDQGERPFIVFYFTKGSDRAVMNKGYRLNAELTTQRYPGDNGIDVFGPYKKYILVCQCKNYTSDRIGRRYVAELIGPNFCRFPDKHMIGIFVTSLLDGYAERARLWAKGSNILILLTSIWNLEQVLLNLPWNPYAINEESLQKIMEESLKLAYRQEDRTKSIKQEVTRTHQDMKELSPWIL